MTCKAYDRSKLACIDGLLAAASGTNVLLEALAILPYEGEKPPQAWYIAKGCHIGCVEPERPLAVIPDISDTNRYDESVVKGTRSDIH
jgi:hypothetical protein